jgi:hypothetical protein
LDGTQMRTMIPVDYGSDLVDDVHDAMKRTGQTNRSAMIRDLVRAGLSVVGNEDVPARQVSRLLTQAQITVWESLLVRNRDAAVELAIEQLRTFEDWCAKLVEESDRAQQADEARAKEARRRTAKVIKARHDRLKSKASKAR